MDPIEFTVYVHSNFSTHTQGTPILQEISNDCHYEFDWPTNIMCPMHVAEFHNSTCQIYNSQTNQSIDLKTIFQNGFVKVRKLQIDSNFICDV